MLSNKVATNIFDTNRASNSDMKNKRDMSYLNIDFVNSWQILTINLLLREITLHISWIKKCHIGKL